LKQRLRDGCDNAAQLYREIKQQGSRGSSATVRRLLRTWGQSLPGSVAKIWPGQQII